MPYFENQSEVRTVSLDRMDGLGAVINIEPGQSIFGSSTYLDQFSDQGSNPNMRWLTRVSDLVTVAGTHQGSDVWSFKISPFTVNSLTALDMDEDEVDTIVVGTAYTMWGIITWTDGGGTSTREFIVTGDGPNSNGGAPNTTITLGANVGSATADLEAVNNASAFHSISSLEGIISIAFDASITSTTIQINYNPIDTHPNAGHGADHPAKGKRVCTVRTFVTSADIADFPLRYIAASENMIKQERIFIGGSAIGSPVLVRDYWYETANSAGHYNGTDNYPVPSRIWETDSTLTLSDLT